MHDHLIARYPDALAQSEIDRNGAALHLDLTDGLPPILGDSVQLQQMLGNLMLNAIEATSGLDRRFTLRVLVRP